MILRRSQFKNVAFIDSSPSVKAADIALGPQPELWNGTKFALHTAQQLYNYVEALKEAVESGKENAIENYVRGIGVPPDPPAAEEIAAVAYRMMKFILLYIGGWDTNAKKYNESDELYLHPDAVVDRVAKLHQSMMNRVANAAAANIKDGIPAEGYTQFIGIMVDIEQGWGDLSKLQKTVMRLVQAGACAFHLEQQSEIAKICGHGDNKAISTDLSMVLRHDAVQAGVVAALKVLGMSSKEALATAKKLFVLVHRSDTLSASRLDKVGHKQLTPDSHYWKFVQKEEVVEKAVTSDGDQVEIRKTVPIETDDGKFYKLQPQTIDENTGETYGFELAVEDTARTLFTIFTRQGDFGLYKMLWLESKVPDAYRQYRYLSRVRERVMQLAEKAFGGKNKIPEKLVQLLRNLKIYENYSPSFDWDIWARTNAVETFLKLSQTFLSVQGSDKAMSIDDVQKWIATQGEERKGDGFISKDSAAEIHKWLTAIPMAATRKDQAIAIEKAFDEMTAHRIRSHSLLSATLECLFQKSTLPDYRLEGIMFKQLAERWLGDEHFSAYLNTVQKPEIAAAKAGRPAYSQYHQKSAGMAKNGLIRSTLQGQQISGHKGSTEVVDAKKREESKLDGLSLLQRLN